MRRTLSSSAAGAIFLFWPLGAVVGAFFSYRSSWAKNILWFYVAFYGFTLVVTEGGDANRYIERFLWFGKFDWTLNNFLPMLYSQETKYVDVVEPLLSFFLSRLTDDPRVLLATFGLVFGYFYSRNIWYLLTYSNFRIKPYTLILIVTFAIIVGFWQINGFRFWTAAHVFLFGALPYLLENRKKGLVFAACAVFFHAAFALPVLVLLVHFLTGSRIKIFFVAFIVSFFISEIDFQVVRNFLSFLPDLFYDRASMYVYEDYALSRLESATQLSWHALVYGKALQIAALSLAVFAFLNRRVWAIREDSLARLFSFTLLFYSFFNILSGLPSFGRFLSVGALLMFAFAFLLFQSDIKLKGKRELVFILLPLILLFDIVSIRIAFDFLGLYSVFGNPLSAWFGPGETALIDFIK